MQKATLLIPLLVLLGACAAPIDEDFIAKDGFDLDKLTVLAREVLTDLQEPSFLENVEYCGVITMRPDGALVAMDHNRGNHSNCEILVAIPPGWKFVAHYHTHGGFDPKKFGEVPTPTDMTYVNQSGILGFVSTPGGRFWRFGGASQTAELICGPKCLPQDPHFDGSYEPEEFIQNVYTKNELKLRKHNRNG